MINLQLLQYRFIQQTSLWLQKSRHPGNLLPSFWDKKRCQGAKNDIKWPKPTQNQRKNSPKQQLYFWLPPFLKFFPGMINFLHSCGQTEAEHSGEPVRVHGEEGHGTVQGCPHQDLHQVNQEEEEEEEGHDQVKWTTYKHALWYRSINSIAFLQIKTFFSVMVMGYLYTKDLNSVGR